MDSASGLCRGLALGLGLGSTGGFRWRSPPRTEFCQSPRGIVHSGLFLGGPFGFRRGQFRQSPSEIVRGRTIPPWTFGIPPRTLSESGGPVRSGPSTSPQWVHHGLDWRSPSGLRSGPQASTNKNLIVLWRTHDGLESTGYSAGI